MPEANSGTSVGVLTRKICIVCGGSKLTQVFLLPKFPLTGIFTKPGEGRSYPHFDQALMHCTKCGHAQLLNVIDPVYLYQETYTHRGSLSAISVAGNDFFYDFLGQIIGDRQFSCVVEVGCNDLYLLKRLRGKAKWLFGVDPIWKDEKDAVTDNIRVIGKFIEEVEWRREVPFQPDLVISAHTFEHVAEPLQTLKPLYDHAADGTIFVLEVPGFDSLLKAFRFDQVFHQHLNYFSVASMHRMIERLGGEYLTHTFNYDYWMGTMLMAFRKVRNGESRKLSQSSPTAAPSTEDIIASYQLFQRQMRTLMEIMNDMSKRDIPIFGYGAAQMVPTLAYHLGSSLKFLKGIFDDNPGKNGLTYPGLAVEIISTKDLRSLADAAVLVTAIDSTRNILPRLKSLRARYILHPFQVF